MYKILFILMLLSIQVIYGQTPEEQKLIDKSLKSLDSIMNTPEMKAMEKLTEAREKKQKSNTEPEKKNTPKVKPKFDKYWVNTLSSNNDMKLKGWNNGVADLGFNYNYDSRKDKVEYVKVGNIKADGTIILNPKHEIPVLKPLNNFKNSNVFYDIHNPDSYQYTNENTGFKLNSYVLVYQNEQKIGVLTVGNSAKVTRNLLTPGDLYFGDEGYMLSWVYVEEACAIRANENWKGDLGNTGTPLIVETNVVYNLSFKPGWNLIKTEIIGAYQFPNAPEEDRSRYKKHEHTIITKIPNDATYFFRSAEHY
ncbi:hypothetical protein [Aureibaculum luteum]|uniref:hypothetical protein n=1 Tax=Aureibaculum luteum TaxID=1548456 RepID=UPI0013009194|nr:hypothetical protein [Aureibaculum luteum]